MKKLIYDSTSEEINDSVIKLTTKRKEFGIIWVSDAHFDSDKCERKFLHKILQEYPEDFIVIGGDSVDVMQGRNDRRGGKGNGMDGRADYFNHVEEFVRKELHDKYKDRIICWNRGNHDNSIIKHNEIDLIKHICREETPVGNAGGYLIVSINHQGKKHLNKIIHYSHQPISGGNRSKGMLSVDIIRGKYPDADIFITEHIHNAWVHPEKKEEINTAYLTPVEKLQWFVQNTTLKNEFKGKRNGFHHEQIKSGPVVIGVIRLTFKFARNTNERWIEIPMPEILVKK